MRLPSSDLPTRRVADRIADRIRESAAQVVSRVQMQANGATLTCLASVMAHARRTAWDEVIATLVRMREEDQDGSPPPMAFYDGLLRFARASARELPAMLEVVPPPVPPVVDEAEEGEACARIGNGLRRIALTLWEAQPWPPIGDIRRAMMQARLDVFQRLAAKVGPRRGPEADEEARARISSYATDEADSARLRAAAKD
jgi:hypothetical protein